MEFKNLVGRDCMAEIARLTLEYTGQKPPNDDLYKLVAGVVELAFDRGWELAKQASLYFCGECESEEWIRTKPEVAYDLGPGPGSEGADGQ